MMSGGMLPDASYPCYVDKNHHQVAAREAEWNPDGMESQDVGNMGEEDDSRNLNLGSCDQCFVTQPKCASDDDAW